MVICIAKKPNSVDQVNVQKRKMQYKLTVCSTDESQQKFQQSGIKMTHLYHMRYLANFLYLFPDLIHTLYWGTLKRDGYQPKTEPGNVAYRNIQTVLIRSMYKKVKCSTDNLTVVLYLSILNQAHFERLSTCPKKCCISV